MGVWPHLSYKETDKLLARQANVLFQLFCRRSWVMQNLTTTKVGGTFLVLLAVLGLYAKNGGSADVTFGVLLILVVLLVIAAIWKAVTTKTMLREFKKRHPIEYDCLCP